MPLTKDWLDPEIKKNKSTNLKEAPLPIYTEAELLILITDIMHTTQ